MPGAVVVTARTGAVMKGFGRALAVIALLGAVLGVAIGLGVAIWVDHGDVRERLVVFAVAAASVFVAFCGVALAIMELFVSRNDHSGDHDGDPFR